MAQSLETLRSNAVTSIYGRRLGLHSDETLVGVKDLKLAVEDVGVFASTALVAGSTILGYGITRVLTSGSSLGPTQYTLPAPTPGVRKHIVMNTTSTGSAQFLSTGAGASILAASDGTTKALVNLLGQGGSVTLMGLTTAIWAVIGYTSTGSVTYTTST